MFPIMIVFNNTYTEAQISKLSTTNLVVVLDNKDYITKLDGYKSAPVVLDGFTPEYNISYKINIPELLNASDVTIYRDGNKFHQVLDKDGKPTVSLLTQIPEFRYDNKKWAMKAFDKSLVPAELEEEAIKFHAEYKVEAQARYDAKDAMDYSTKYQKVGGAAADSVVFWSHKFESDDAKLQEYIASSEVGYNMGGFNSKTGIFNKRPLNATFEGTTIVLVERVNNKKGDNWYFTVSKIFTSSETKLAMKSFGNGTSEVVSIDSLFENPPEELSNSPKVSLEAQREALKNKLDAFAFSKIKTDAEVVEYYNAYFGS